MNMIFDNTLSDYCLVELLLVPWYTSLETINAVCVKTVDDGASDIPLVQGRTVSPSLVHTQVQNSHYVDVDAALAILPAQSTTRDRIFSVTADTRAASNKINMHARRNFENVHLVSRVKPLYPLTHRFN